MPMKMKFDFSESKRQIAPEGEYSLRFKEKVVKNSKAGKPMIEIQWKPFDPPAGVSMDEIDKCIIWDRISLAPNALFSLKALCAASNQDVECSNCSTVYEATNDVCPSCQSPLFEVDLDFIDEASPRAFVKIEPYQGRDTNKIEKYFV